MEPLNDSRRCTLCDRPAEHHTTDARGRSIYACAVHLADAWQADDDD